MVRFIFVSIFIFLLSIQLKSQDVLPWLNDSLEINLSRVSAEYNFEDSTFIPSKLIFDINLRDTQITDVESLTYEKWIYLLEDLERGFLIYVLLNSIFEKDIHAWSRKEAQEDYESAKEKEIGWWKLFLSENIPIIVGEIIIDFDDD
ncbi:MAG: hypothetical protein AB8F94_24555 [Saprospiraceae bacterium]